jgi:uncharacterized protein (DUF488 family)
VIFTVGHSTHPIEAFIDMLAAHGVRQLSDVRTIPRSRHNPQFNSEALAAELARHGIAYRHLPGLGGLRHPRTDSINTGWKNASFRGYADYMQTSEFNQAIERAVHLAQTTMSALLCAEAVPWRCHRSLVADALLVRGIHVEQIIDGGKPTEHKLTPFARVRGTRITYPSDQGSLLGPT